VLRKLTDIVCGANSFTKVNTMELTLER